MTTSIGFADSEGSASLDRAAAMTHEVEQLQEEVSSVRISILSNLEEVKSNYTKLQAHEASSKQLAHQCVRASDDIKNLQSKADSDFQRLRGIEAHANATRDQFYELLSRAHDLAMRASSAL